jgi:GT2 family glycosyltransferase
MKLSIVIVSWNIKDLLKECLQSIRASLGDFELEVYVVDNNSQDGTVEMMRQDFPKVKLIANDNNLGFARANNQALKQATGDYILLLNPDTKLFPDTLAKASNWLIGRPEVGIMGIRLLNADASLQPSVRRFPKFWPILLMLLKIPKILPNLKSINRYLATDFDYVREQEVDQVMGAFMLTKREVLDKVGLLDERFFIWFEEVDWCKRIKAAGYKVFYTPVAEAIHYGGKSFAQEKVATKQWNFFRSALKYFLKHGI